MHTKRIASGQGKEMKWAATVNGPHEKDESVPLITVLRELGLVDKSREAKAILKAGKVLVDGRVVRDHRFGVGLMDIVSIPDVKGNYRIVPDKKGFTYKEVGAKEAKLKPCKVIGKTLVNCGQVQLNLHDGSNILSKDGVNVNDTVVVALPDRKVKETVPYAVGSQVLIARGRHRGEKGVVKDILHGTAGRKSLTTVGDFQTLTDYVFPIGVEKAVVDV